MAGTGHKPKEIKRAKNGQILPGSGPAKPGRRKLIEGKQQIKKYSKTDIETMYMSVLTLPFPEMMGMFRQLERIQHSKGDPQKTRAGAKASEYMKRVKELSAAEAWVLSVVAKSVIRGDHKLDSIILSRMIGRVPDHVHENQASKLDEFFKTMNEALPKLEEAEKALKDMKVVNIEVVKDSE